MSSLEAMFEEDSQVSLASDEDLNSIAGLANQAVALEKEIERQEAYLGQAKERLRKLTDEIIPAALAEKGMSSFKMVDGSEVEVKPYYSATISADNRGQAFTWLRDNGYGDIIKNIVSTQFGRGEDELARDFITMARQQGFIVDQNEKVEPMTLKAWVRERVERGEEFPTELFGAYIGQRAKIGKPKSSK